MDCENQNESSVIFERVFGGDDGRPRPLPLRISCQPDCGFCAF